MNPNYLGKLVMVGMNKKFYKPPVAQIKERYYKMYRGKGSDLESADPLDGASA